MKKYLQSLGSRVFYGWWIIGLGSIIIAVGAGILYQSFTIFFLPLQRDLGASRAAISMLYGAARLEGGAEGPLVGYLVDRFGSRRIIIGGAGVAGIGLILLATVENFWTFFLIYVFIVSIGYDFGFFQPIYKLVNSWFIRRRAVGFAIVSASANVGGMIAAPVISFLIFHFGWRPAAVLAGLAIILIAIPCALPLHGSPEMLGLTPDGKKRTEDKGPHPLQIATDVDFTVKEAVRTSAYWLLVGGISMRLFVTVALSVHFVPILVWKGMDETTSAYLVSLFAFSAIFTALAMGWWGDRWNKGLISSLGVLPLAGALVWLGLSPSTAALYILPVGFAVAMGTPAVNWALIGDFFGRHSYATLRGIMALFYGIGTFFSPIYAGWIFDRTESYAIVLFTFAAVLVVSSVFFFLLPHPSQLQEKKSSAPRNPG
jgi:sugar phosphate permease